MDLLDYVAAVRQRWLVILALLLLGTVAGAAYAQSIPNSYRASSSVFVTAQQNGDAQQAYQGNQYSVAAVQSYVRLATLPAVLDPVREKLGLTATDAQLARQLTVEAQTDTVIIDITATDDSPKAAAELAQAVAQSLVTKAQSLAPTTSKNQSILKIEIVATATPPSAPFAPNRTLYTILGLVFGFVAGVVYAVARRVFGTRIGAEEDLLRTTDLPILGRIGRTARRTGLVMRTQPEGAQAEDYRRLRTNLDFADIDRAARLVVVTSSMPGDGKSTTALNLALAMAESGSRVLIVDGDLRKPTVADYLGIEGGVGLTSVLIGRASLEEATQSWGSTNLDVLPSGPLAPNPSQLIGSERMRALLGELREQYDHVIVDAAPILAVTDTLSIAEAVDGVLVVALNKTTRRSDLARTLESLALVRANVLGLVLNQTPTASKATYGYSAKEVAAKPGLTAATPSNGVSFNPTAQR